MVTTVLSRPNHYERLGLPPDAGDEEIARAFALAMSPLMPRTVRDIAEIGQAFETLRDPAKRRAYDAAIAPTPEPEPEPGPEPEAKPMFPRAGWPFTASARIASAELPPIDSLPRPARKAEAPFIASAVQPEARDEPEPEVELRPSPVHIPTIRYAEPRPVEWKRPAVAVGGLFLGVAVIGAGLGWYASRGIAPAQAEQSVTFPIPKAQPAPAPKTAEARPEQRTGAAAASPKTRHAAPRPRPVLAEERRAEEVPDIPSEQVAALASGAAEAPVAMPLPDSVVARTIGRIGYPCGAVESTAAVEGVSGVFKVTCTSGDSYRAAPVRGRYHFKRWSGH